MFVKPQPGLLIRDPDLKDFLPPEGREVPDSDYWRRMRDLFRDVVAVDPPVAPASKEPAE